MDGHVLGWIVLMWLTVEVEGLQVTVPEKKKVAMLFQPALLRCHFSTSSTQPAVVQWRFKSYCQDRMGEALGMVTSGLQTMSKRNLDWDPYLDCVDSRRTVRVVASKQGSAITIGDFYKERDISIVHDADLQIGKLMWGDSGLYYCLIITPDDVEGKNEESVELLVLGVSQAMDNWRLCSSKKQCRSPVTNGTVINKLKVVKKQTYPLQTGDVIYVVYRKNEPENNVAYLYESLNTKHDATQEPVEVNVENQCHVTKDTSSTRRSNDETQITSSLSATQSCYEEPQPSTSTSNLFNAASTSLTESASVQQDNPSTSGSQPSVFTPVPAFPVSECVCLRALHGEHEKLAMDTETSAITSEITDKENTESDSQGTGEEEGLEPAKKKMKGDEDACPNLSPAAPSECIIKIGSEDAKTSNVKPDKMEETLTCIICQELLHDCVSLQPCMHTFCAACYSGWMERSSLCPTCRCPVERICKNHILNNLVEAYLIQHPDKCRNEDDVRSMDARNKITQDMLQPKVRRSFSDEEGSSEDLLELSDVDSESSDISQPYIVCRQCPGYRRHSVPTLPGTGQETEAGGMQALGDAPSTSANFPAAVQEYVCPAQGSHVICTCCFQPMPDRRAEREQNPHVAPQQCTVCLQPFCHLYWGCTRMACFGCLAPFCEINLGDKCLDGVLNNNHYESDILKDYLASRGLTWKNMLNESLLALQRGVFMLSDYRVTGNTVLCYCCGLRSFRELAYQYRQNIPVAELPVTVTSRPDCYWGRNCRTQVKAHHAMKFNHICEQTRFKN